ncbi:MAG: hypothetical protein AMJ46_02140 [Latescibacteria bacterium DG_63]|nr:MAG: hypothetical protein AMJ46_02140 [Latescibacteria bacterium DG_63]
MEFTTSRFLRWLLILAVGLSALHCGASNRLREYEFRNHTATAIMMTSPTPQVFTQSFLRMDEDDLLGTAISLGTTIAKGVQVHETQERLNNAMESVDIPEQIRIQTLKQCSEYLHFQPVQQSANADFLFVMTVSKYGIEANSWDSSVRFRIDVKIRLMDNRRNIKIWEKSIKEGQPISRGMFGLGEAAGDVITAVTLARLSEEEMVRGFAYLADYVADRIAERIQNDFIKAHSS